MPTRSSQISPRCSSTWYVVLILSVSVAAASVGVDHNATLEGVPPDIKYTTEMVAEHTMGSMFIPTSPDLESQGGALQMPNH